MNVSIYTYCYDKLEYEAIYTRAHTLSMHIPARSVWRTIQQTGT